MVYSLNAAVNRNIALYPIHQMAFSAFFWTPIFFLYYLEVISIQEALIVDAFYYLCVVLLEVPSGYFADRFGRKLTLVISSLCQVAAYICFYMANSFLLFLLAKFFFAIAFSFSSGADTSFFYSSLEKLGLENEYGDREASIRKKALYVTAASTLIGGICGTYFGLRSAYLLSAIAALVCLFCSLLFKEVETQTDSVEHTLVKQIRRCLSYLKDGRILWLVMFMVLMTILNHIPYEFYQKYTDLLGVKYFNSTDKTALSTGILAFVMNIFAAFFAGKSMSLYRKFGTKLFFLMVVLAQTIVISFMAFFLHWWVLIPIVLYRVPANILRAPFNHSVTPYLQNSHRATFLSLVSLAGRLAFGFTLLMLSRLVGLEVDDNWPALSTILQVSAAIAASGLLFLIVFSRKEQFKEA